MSQQTLGFGIIGVGMIADFHAQAIAHTTGGRLVGVATRNADNARAFAQKHHLALATTSIDELVARSDIQVVCITTPSGAHLEPALAAVRAGNVVVANSLGSGVIETSAMSGFLPALCRSRMGEKLKIPSLAARWCREDKAPPFVLANSQRALNMPPFSPFWARGAFAPPRGALVVPLNNFPRGGPGATHVGIPAPPPPPWAGGKAPHAVSSPHNFSPHPF